jgi:hypothetical protein
MDLQSLKYRLFMVAVFALLVTTAIAQASPANSPP